MVEASGNRLSSVNKLNQPEQPRELSFHGACLLFFLKHYLELTSLLLGKSDQIGGGGNVVFLNEPSLVGSVCVEVLLGAHLPFRKGIAPHDLPHDISSETKWLALTKSLVVPKEEYDILPCFQENTQ